MNDQFRKLNELISQQEHKIRSAYNPPMKDPEKIPVLLTGGVGDVIMGLPVAEAISMFGEIEIYTPHPEVCDYFNYYGLPKAKPLPVPNYTWFLDVNAVVRFKLQDSFSGFYNPRVETLLDGQQSVFRQHPKLETLCKNHPLQDSGMARWARDLGLDRRQIAFFSLGIGEIPPIKLERAKPEKYITIHDGYETASSPFVQGRATKTWKWEHWNSLVKKLKEKYPDYAIVQLGAKTARLIDGVDSCQVNKTTIIQAIEILKRSSFHIDGCSGFVHAATALQVPCAVLFGPTPAYFFGYKENANLTSGFCHDACYWLTKDWLSQCPIGLNTPKCMDEITPDQVLEAVKIERPQ